MCYRFILLLVVLLSQEYSWFAECASTLKPTIVYSKHGDAVSFQCCPTAPGLDEIDYFDKAPLPDVEQYALDYQDNRLEFNVGSMKCTYLSLGYVTEKDTGRYRCTTKFDKAVVDYKVFLEYRIGKVETDQILLLNKKGHNTIHVNITGSIPLVEWRKVQDDGSKRLLVKYQEEFVDHKPNNDSFKYYVSWKNGSLIINNVDKSDGGKYEMSIVSTVYGNKKEIFNIAIQAKATILGTNTKVITADTKQITIRCSATGVPLPTFRLSLPPAAEKDVIDGAENISSSVPSYDGDVGSVEYKIKTGYDFVICTAENMHGFDTTRLWLPHPTPKPTTTTTTTTKSMTPEKINTTTISMTEQPEITKTTSSTTIAVTIATATTIAVTITTTTSPPASIPPTAKGSTNSPSKGGFQTLEMAGVFGNATNQTIIERRKIIYVDPPPVSKKTVIIGVSIAGGVVLFIVLVLVMCCVVKRQRQKEAEEIGDVEKNKTKGRTNEDKFQQKQEGRRGSKNKQKWRNSTTKLSKISNTVKNITKKGGGKTSTNRQHVQQQEKSTASVSKHKSERKHASGVMDSSSATVANNNSSQRRKSRKPSSAQIGRTPSRNRRPTNSGTGSQQKMDSVQMHSSTVRKNNTRQQR